MTPKQVVDFAKENGAMMVDYKFMDFIGTWQHVSVPMSEFSVDTFEEGQGFDGSSIRGWQPIHASDMILLPDPTSAKMDPFVAVPTLSLICDIFDPITKEDYTRDPRNIAKKAEMYLKSTGIGDTAFFGPEAEFFIFPLTHQKAPGIPVVKSSRTLATSRATRKVTSPVRRLTHRMICATKWSWNCRRSASVLNVSITRLPPAARLRSICVSPRWLTWLISCSGSSMSSKMLPTATARP